MGGSPRPPPHVFDEHHRVFTPAQQFRLHRDRLTINREQGRAPHLSINTGASHPPALARANS